MSITVIVPAYETSAYLERCLVSIFNQSTIRIETIVIDDGSIDCTGAIADYFASAFQNIIVVHSKNQGVSSARNMGLNIACGRYITFIDSDDYVSSNYLKHLLQYHNKDLVVEGWMVESESGEILDSVVFEAASYSARSMSVTNFLMSGKANCVCGKLFSNSIITKNKVRFNTCIDYAEDTAFCIDYIEHINTIQVSNETAYHYVKYGSRSTLSGGTNDVLDILQRAKLGNGYIAQRVSEYENINASDLLLSRMSWLYDNALSQAKWPNSILLYLQLCLSERLFIMYRLRKKLYVIKRVLRNIGSSCVIKQ